MNTKEGNCWMERIGEKKEVIHWKKRKIIQLKIAEGIIISDYDHSDDVHEEEKVTD